MKNKKTLLATLCLAMLLVIATLFVACSGKDETTFYEVTIAEYDSQLGTVTLSKPSNERGYATNESVTVTVSPNAGYFVETFTVSGHDDAALDADGKYVFAVTTNTVVTVSFAIIPESGFSVTIQNNNTEFGSVALSAPADGEKYDANENVTVSVTPAAGHYVKTFVVSGKPDAALNADNKYTFAVTADTTVTVEFNIVPSLTQEVLDSLSGKLSLEGYCRYVSATSDMKFNMKTTFTEDAYYSYELLLNDNSVDEITVFKNAQSKPVTYYLKRDNTYGEEEMMKDTDADFIGDTPAVWADFANPFDELTLADFSASTKLGEYILKNSKADKVANTITRYNETMDIFTINVEEGKVTGLYFMYENSTESCKYSLTVTAHGNDVQPLQKPESLPTTANHEKLSAALEELATGNFTMSHSMTEENVTTAYPVYYADNAYFYDYVGDASIEPGGAVVLKDGIYNFAIENGSLVKGEKTMTTNIKAFNPQYKMSVAMFEDKGNGLFEVYDKYLQEDYGTIAQVAAPMLDNLTDRGNYALNLRIQLTADMQHVQSISYDFAVIGDLWEGSMVLTFSNFGYTAAPLNFSVIEPIPGPTGTFATEDYNILGLKKLVLSDATMTFSYEYPDFEPDVEVSFTVKGNYLLFTLNDGYEDINLVADYWGEELGWRITNADNLGASVLLFFKEYKPELPGPTGTFKADQNDLGIETVEITDTTISFDDETMQFTIVEGSMSNHLEFTYDKKTYTAEYYDGYGWMIQCSDPYMYFYAKAASTSSLPGPTGTFTVDHSSSTNKFGDISVTTVEITDSTISFDGDVMQFTIIEGHMSNHLEFTYKDTTLNADYYVGYGWAITSSDYSIFFYAN